MFESCRVHISKNKASSFHPLDLSNLRSLPCSNYGNLEPLYGINYFAIDWNDGIPRSGAVFGL